MNDVEIIETMANLWITLGGDAEGFLWCNQKIAEKIRELTLPDKAKE